VLLCNFIYTLVFEERRAGATQRAVGGNVDAFFLAKVHNFLLWAERVVLDLVHSRGDGGFGEQLLEVLDRVVGDTNGLDLIGVRLD
jgi:hypothetical protein